MVKLICKGCGANLDYRSDGSGNLKERFVASSMAAGISHGKYKRLGTALGKRQRRHNEIYVP